VSNIAAGLTISAVAARTGVSVPVLRAWEQRFGFPLPRRLESGHRRYAEDDVARIQRVVAERAAGRSLEAAIEVALQGTASGPPAEVDRSIFAGLHRARPDLTTQVISRRTMLALSRAIEDECFAQADRPHLIAAFQTRTAYAAGQPRWDELIGSATATLVFADFPTSRRRRGRLEIAIPDGDPLQREWAVVCDAPGSAALLAGWERPDGRFEAMWTVDADVVRLATDLGRRLAAAHAPRLELPAPPSDTVPSHDPVAALRRSTAITTRAITRLT
jgi:DNA-binding transcriptional MerR regulator